MNSQLAFSNQNMQRCFRVRVSDQKIGPTLTRAICESMYCGARIQRYSKNLGASQSVPLQKSKLSYRCKKHKEARRPLPFLLPEILNCSGGFYSKLQDVDSSDVRRLRAKREGIRVNTLAKQMSVLAVNHTVSSYLPPFLFTSPPYSALVSREVHSTLCYIRSTNSESPFCKTDPYVSTRGTGFICIL